VCRRGGSAVEGLDAVVGLNRSERAGGRGEGDEKGEWRDGSMRRGPLLAG
jgi:hypothetical protein